MDLNKQQDDPHGVQALLAKLRQQQDSSSSSTSTTAAAVSSSTSSSTRLPGLADSYDPSRSADWTASVVRRRQYNVQPRYGSGYEAGVSGGGYEPYDDVAPAPRTVDVGAAQSAGIKRKAGEHGDAAEHATQTDDKTMNKTTTKTTTPPDPRPRASSNAQSEPAAPNLRDLTFPASLPHLSTLSSQPGFLSSLSTLKRGQDDVERRLAASYASQRKTLQRPTMDEKTRRYEENKLLRSLLRQWDEEVERQQRQLESLKVPCCYVTDEVGRRKRQRKVVEVLEGMLEE